VRLSLSPDSEMRVFQYQTITSVEVEQGVVAYSTLGQSEDLALYALDVKIVPDTKQPTFGQVDVASPCELSVQSIKGSVAVTSAKETKIVEESKAYDVTPKLGVNYSDNWRPVLEDYPDYPREAKYHESHHHVACAAAPLQNASIRPAFTSSSFREIAVVGGLAGTSAILWYLESESPSKPQ
jgi:hypothetical protein